MTLSLPTRPSLSYLRKQAKSLLKRHQAKNADVCSILRNLHRFTDAAEEDILSASVSLVEVQFALAMEYGFKDWSDLKTHVEARETPPVKTAVDPSAWPEMRRAILTEAVSLGASDTHLEWNRDRLVVRQRVDGALRPSDVSIDKEQSRSVLDGFKMLGALDTTVHDEPQVGLCLCDVNGKRVSMRISVVPYTSGESIVIRHLPDQLTLDMNAFGWPSETLERFRRWIRRPTGLIVVTGPTGSGMTTTIYGALRELAADGGAKIITAENPVEYQIDGILQQQIGPLEGVSYAQAVTAQMRQDPDIMFVGECKDSETLEVILHAAITGHLVFTTMHADDAPACLRRLLDLKNDPYRIGGALIGVLSQRLVRKICEDCRESHEPPAWVRQSLPELPTGKFSRGKGCPACRNSGYRGRVAIAEMLEVDDAYRELLARNAAVEEFRKRFKTSGTHSLRTAGLLAAAEGITAIDEVLRVCPG
ncbi:MAG: type II/IV secretion system protein [Phycisphaerae bacterium]|nr:type II/IV secretion system protein [Phycisphaerae bacterium]